MKICITSLGPWTVAAFKDIPFRSLKGQKPSLIFRSKYTLPSHLCTYTYANSTLSSYNIPHCLKVKVSYKWPMFSSHRLCSLLPFWQDSLKFSYHRIKVVEALDFILSFLTNNVFISILQVWSMLSSSSHAFANSILSELGAKESPRKVPLPSLSGNNTYLRGSWKMLILVKYSENTKSYMTDWKTLFRGKSK